VKTFVVGRDEREGELRENELKRKRSVDGPHRRGWTEARGLLVRDESGADNFRIRSDPNPNPNYADMEKSF
jgi:hypothetical protein